MSESFSPDKRERLEKRLRDCCVLVNYELCPGLVDAALEAADALAVPSLAAPSRELHDACELLLDYRRRNGANFQLEKADTFLKRIDAALDAPPSPQAPQPSSNRDAKDAWQRKLRAGELVREFENCCGDIDPSPLMPFHRGVLERVFFDCLTPPSHTAPMSAEVDAVIKELREQYFAGPLALRAESLIRTLWVQSATLTPELFNDALWRIVERMSGHTISAADGPAWDNFFKLLQLTTPYSCGIGPMPREGNAPTDDRSQG